MKKAQQQKCFNPNTKIKCTTFMLKRKYFRKNMHFKWNVNDGQNRKKNRKNTLSCMLEYQESITAGKIKPNNPGYFSMHFIWEHWRDWTTSGTGKAVLSFVTQYPLTLVSSYTLLNARSQRCSLDTVQLSVHHALTVLTTGSATN